MRHDVTITGVGFSLRPLTLDDASFVVGLRSDLQRAQHLHPTSPDVSDQIAWTERYFDREGDWYFVVEHRKTGAREGLIAIYDVAEDKSVGELGRWILRAGSLAAIESAALALDVAFDVLGIDDAITRTRAANQSVVSFWSSFGALPLGRATDVTGEDLVEQHMTPHLWRERRPAVAALVEGAARLASR